MGPAAYTQRRENRYRVALLTEASETRGPLEYADGKNHLPKTVWTIVETEARLSLGGFL